MWASMHVHATQDLYSSTDQFFLDPVINNVCLGLIQAKEHIKTLSRPLEPLVFKINGVLWVQVNVMSQLITSNFDGFWAIKSECKVQSRQTWLQMKGIAKLH